MRIATFPAGAFRTNCYIVSSDDSYECMIIDPGQDAAPQVCDIIDTNKLHPAGIYLTHGHADHVWNTPELSEKYDIPVVVHHDDMFMLEDPAVGVGAGLSSVFPFNGWKPPRLLTTYQDNELLIGGLSVTVLPLPGHTPGEWGFLLRIRRRTRVLRRYCFLEILCSKVQLGVLIYAGATHRLCLLR